MARLCEDNLEAVLSDHAWCEQKAASNAISTITKYPMYPELVDALTKSPLKNWNTSIWSLIRFVRGEWSFSTNKKIAT